MAAYAAIAVGLINLRYQTGSENNFAKSAALLIPGTLLIGASFIQVSKTWLLSKTAAITTLIIGTILLIYSFIL